jgi:hypothetical protein
MDGLGSVSPPSVLPDISPSRGEIGSFDRQSLNGSVENLIAQAAPQLISPLEGEMSGRTEGGDERFGLTSSAAERQHIQQVWSVSK